MTKYPSELDTDTELPPVSDGISEYSGEAINALRQAVFAVERALGTLPQGSAATLSDRLAQVLNDDGTFKAAALVASGLIALPITNAQIGSSAAIAESKLDLDIPTQSLQNQLNADRTDILTLQESLADDINDLSRHILGLSGLHDGYMITIDGLTDHAEIDTVEGALDFIWDTFLDHKAATVAGEHNASAISYSPLDGGAIPDTNVQDALETIDEGFTEQRRLHNDSAHSDGVSNDGYVVLGGQAATNDASLKLTRYQSFAGAQDIIKIGHANAASVKTKGFQAGAITSTASEFNIVAGIGTGIERTLSITGLHTARYPATNSRITLEGVVDYINQAAATLTEHFPISAFASPDGELVIQHNIDRSDCTLKITAGGQSAISALGFADIVGLTVSNVSEYQFTVNGSPYSALKTISTGQLTLSALSSTLNLGVAVGSGGLELFDNSLIHIYNHTTASVNGTYRIAQISPASPSPSTTIGLATSIAAGTFNYVIYADCFDMDFIGAPRVVDLYLDSSRDATTVERAAVTFGGLGGVKIVELSQDFPAVASGTITLSTSGSSRSIVISDGSTSGLPTLFDSGFLGYIKIFAPDNKAYATALVSDITLVNGTDTFTSYAAASPEAKLFLGTAHFDSSTTIELPIDKRNVGMVGLTAVGTEFVQGVIERDLSNLKSNGFVRGFEASTLSSSTITIDGGAAYVDGHFISKAKQNLSVTTFATSAGTYNVVLTKRGQFEIYNDSSAGFSAADILLNRSFLLICQLTVSAAPAVTAISDARFFINNSDEKITFRVEDRDFGSGAFRSIAAAQLYATNSASESNPIIQIFSELSEATVSIAAGQEIQVYGDLVVSSTLTLGAGARLIVYGSIDVAGNTTVGANGLIAIFGDSTLINVDLAAGSKLHVEADLEATQITVSGDDVSITGSGNARSVIQFAGTAKGIVIDQANGVISGLNLLMGDVAFAIIELLSGANNLLIEKCYLAQDFAITEAGWNTTARAGIVVGSDSVTVSDVIISQCRFSNFAHAITAGPAGANVFDGWIIDSCKIENCGVGIYLEGAENCRITNNLITSILTSHIQFGNTTQAVINNVISGNILEIQSTTSTALTALSIATGLVDNLIINSNLFRNFTGSYGIRILSATGSPSGIIISENIFTSTTTNDNYLLDLENARIFIEVKDNVIVSHTGNVMNANDCSVEGNLFNSTYNTSTKAPLKLGRTFLSPIFASNHVAITTNQYIHFSSAANINNNIFSVASMTIDGIGSTIGLSFTNNIVDLTSSTATTSLTFDTGSNFTSRQIFSGNHIRCAANTVGVQLSDGFFVFSDNVVLGASGNIPATILAITGSSSGHHLINGNHITAASAANYAIFITGNNVSISDNYINAHSGAIAAVSASTGSSNISIQNNFLGGASGGLLISHADTNPSNFHVGENKNYTGNKLQNALAGIAVSGTWAVGVNNALQSSTASSTLLVPLVDLPVGTQIASIVVNVFTTTVGGISVQGLKRVSGAISSSTMTTASTNGSTGLETITLTPSSEYVRSNTDYMLLFTRNSGTVDIGQISVRIKY